MLDSITKKRIDDLRDILVGKIPSPQSQVEQITTGLIYKFMYDMDEESIEMGGRASFFVGNYKKYSWKNLFDPKLSGVDKVKLYSDAIENMYNNPSAPELFREIFKNSFLPFKDPSTLNMFLKGINEFHYSHSEKLGDAFEYLLSFMGSQGDAGQFRTPRHIIDFVVEIVNPQKNETILDPACGTAGFLISSYKHILSQNSEKKSKLSATERKKLGNNLVGYDISPDMSRISLVNMYLHQFANPRIYEYDTLSSEDRWGEYYDVILANPPFFSPKGGIRPHTKFGVQSTRAEVLFVDYIMEHLKPNGRAGIIVPEGIIFQTGNAYKTLRKRLVEDSLVGVISLPAGVFQPYSGVKTSILILDKALSQKTDSIFFAKVENDGYSLGSQRTAIDKNDLPGIVKAIDLHREQKKHSMQTEEKKAILANKDISFNQSTYKIADLVNSNYPMVKLGEVCAITMGQSPNSECYNQKGDGLEFHQGKTKFGDLYLEYSGVWTTQYNKIAEENSILMSVRAPVGPVNITQREIALGRGLCAIKANEDCKQMYLFYILQASKAKLTKSSHGSTFDSINRNQLLDFQIPLPPIEVQQEIVDELEGYQKIIDGCRQVVDNYKPSIDIDPSWEIHSLENISVNISNGLNFSKEQVGLGTRIVNVKDLFNHEMYIKESILERVEITDNEIESKELVMGDILFVRSSVKYEGIGYTALVDKLSEKTVFGGFIIKLSPNLNLVNPFYLCALLRTPYFRKVIISLGNRGTITNISQDSIKSIAVPMPPMEIQEEIVAKIKNEISIIDGTKKLIEIYTKKIQDRISKVWGESPAD